jgi:hypothetical protein
MNEAKGCDHPGCDQPIISTIEGPPTERWCLEHIPPDRRAAYDETVRQLRQVREEMAISGRLVNEAVELTGGQGNYLTIQLTHGETMSLMGLLGVLQTNDVRRGETDHLVEVIGKQMTEQWERPASE